MQASGENFLKFTPDTGAIVFLSLYLALSLTNLSPLVVFIPLALSGLCLLIEPGPPAPKKPMGHDPVAYLAVTLFLLSYFASVLFSNDTLKSLDALAVLFPGLLIAYILLHSPPGCVHYISWCLLLYVATCSCLIILMFVQSNYVNPARILFEGGSAALVVPNDVLAGTIFSPVAAAVWVYDRHPLMKALAVCSLFILAIAVYLTQSRVAILTLFFMVLLYLFFRDRQRFLITGAMVSIALFLIDALLDLGIIRNFWLLREQNSRLGIWLAGLMHWSDHPILGFGPSNFEIAYELGLTELSVPEWVTMEPRRVPWAHSLYVEALVERGLLGLIALVFLMAVIFLRLGDHAKSSDNPLSSFHFFIFIAFCGFAFAGAFEPTMQRIWVANSLFIFLGLACIRHKTSASDRS